MDPIKVIYIVGTTRCGSTLIGSLLGQVPGVVHIGEIARVWQEGFIDNFRCGCGAPFRECAFWREAFERGFGRRDAVDPRRMIEIASRWARTRHTPLLATPRGRQRMRDGMAEYTEAMTDLYRGVLAAAGGRVVLDSSKTPMLAWALADAPGIDLWVLHVTRDPRAVVYSWKRKKFDPAKGVDMHRGETPVGTSLAWLTFNGLAALLWNRPTSATHYQHVRYEDFAADPVAVLRRILAWLDEPIDAGTIVGADRRFTSAPAHTIAGNPIRFQRGAVTIAPDTAWQTEASGWDKLLVSSLTWPLLGRYGYPIR